MKKKLTNKQALNLALLYYLFHINEEALDHSTPDNVLDCHYEKSARWTEKEITLAFDMREVRFYLWYEKAASPYRIGKYDVTLSPRYKEIARTCFELQLFDDSFLARGKALRHFMYWSKE